jgi:hypothetical protein
MIDIVDGRFVLTQKPGLTLFCDFGEVSGVDGLYWSDKLEKVIGVSNGNVKVISDSSGTFTDITGDKLLVGQQVTFTELFDGATPLVFMANGTKIVYTDGTNSSAFHPDSNAPDKVTHVDNLDTYLLANLQGSQSWYYALANSPLDFTNGNSYDAEKGTDDLLALFVSKRRVYLFKKNSIETWLTQPVAGDPFVRMGTTVFFDVGLYSPYAIDLIDRGDGNGKVIAFLNNNRQVCIIDGDQTQIISQPYNRIFQDIDYASDAVMDSISLGGKNLLLITFKSASRSFVYDYANNVWYEWGFWNDTDYDEYPAINYCYAKAWNLHLIGDRTSGKVYKLDRNVYEDNGNPMRTLIRTGHINHGNDAIIKKSLGLTLRCKRGSTSLSVLGNTTRTLDTPSHITCALAEDNTIVSVNNSYGYAGFDCTTGGNPDPYGNGANMVISTGIASYNGIQAGFSVPSTPPPFGFYCNNVPFVGTSTGYMNYPASPLLITSAGHGMSNGDVAIITGTINYNGSYPVTVVDGNNFTINATYVLDEASSMIIKTLAYVDVEPTMRIRKRDNGKGWSNWQDVGLGLEGDTTLHAKAFSRGGTYFTRQYEVMFSDNAPLALSGIWENIQGVDH